MRRFILTEEEKERIKLLYEQVTLGAVNNVALINNIQYKLKAWAGGFLGYQPVQIKGLKILPDGSAELKWKFESAVMSDSGTEIIPKSKVDEILKTLRTNNEMKFELENGKTVKLVKV
jgi:hypothetical protein